jgi:acyl-CoA dehydrogenase
VLCKRAGVRVTFGARLADRGNIQDWIAEARIDIEMARLLTLKTAWRMDTVGNRQARPAMAAIKVAAPAVALRVIDRAIQVHSGAGFPLAWMYAHLRTLRVADGPDEIHKRTIALNELRRWGAETSTRAATDTGPCGRRRLSSGECRSRRTPGHAPRITPYAATSQLFTGVPG